MVSVPSPGYLAHPYSPDGAFLVTGDNEQLVNELKLFPDSKPTAEDQQAANSFAALGLQNVSLQYMLNSVHCIIALCIDQYILLKYYYFLSAKLENN